MTDIPSRKHLVLLGTGRANMSVLKKLVAQGIGGLAVTLVAPQLNYLDEAMLAGHLLGEKALEDFVILCRRWTRRRSVFIWPVARSCLTTRCL